MLFIQPDPTVLPEGTTRILLRGCLHQAVIAEEDRMGTCSMLTALHWFLVGMLLPHSKCKIALQVEQAAVP